MEDILNGRYAFLSYNRSYEILDFGFYYQQLKRYFSFFDKQQFLILFHEDIVVGNLIEIQKLFTFLSCDVSFVPEQLDAKPQSSVYNIQRLRLLRMQNSFIYEYK